jgi:hypothetical protein
MQYRTDGLHPPRDRLRNPRKYNRFTKHCPTQDIPYLRESPDHTWNDGPQAVSTYRSVWTPPHLLELELFHTRLIRGDSRALDADAVFENGIGGVYGDPIVRLR